jgi:heterodisulfide reductase subunit B
MIWNCNVCNQNFDSRASYAGHRSGHVRRGEISKKLLTTHDHKCETCGAKFETGFGLGGHKRLHRTFENIRSDGGRKKRLISERGHQCEVCLNSEWCEKPIPIELDHIDGNPQNHSKDNLRLICPNCHAQTDTYKGKNIGKNGQTPRSLKLKKYYDRDYRGNLSH